MSTRRRNHQRRGSRYTPPTARIDTGVTKAEIEAVIVIGHGQDPANDPCPGPILVHANGSIECHGPDCEGVMVMFHDEDSTEACAYGRHQLGLDLRTSCLRCS